jgi:hypothetical protein
LFRAVVPFHGQFVANRLNVQRAHDRRLLAPDTGVGAS